MDLLPFCKICYVHETNISDLISPCECKGTLKWVHTECLNRWRNLTRGLGSGCRGVADKCELCNATYTVSKKRYRFTLCLYFLIVDFVRLLLEYAYTIVVLFLLWSYYRNAFRDIETAVILLSAMMICLFAKAVRLNLIDGKIAVNLGICLLFLVSICVLVPVFWPGFRVFIGKTKDVFFHKVYIFFLLTVSFFLMLLLEALEKIEDDGLFA